MADYRTKKSGKLLDSILRGRGFDPDTYTIATKEQEQFADAVQIALRTIWEAQLWPFLMKTKRRQYRPTYVATSTYAINDEVYYSDHYWRSKTDGNIGNTPLTTDTVNWTVDPADFKAYIQFTQYWETDEIDDGGFLLPECLFESDPLTNYDLPPIQGVRVWQRSLLVTGDDIVNRPYLVFRPRCPVVSYTAWSGATDYAVGDTCYLASTQTSYVAIVATTNESPDVTATSWAEVGIPENFFDYIRWSAIAELTGEDEGSAKGKLLTKAANELSRLSSVYVTQIGQVAQMRYRGRR